MNSSSPITAASTASANQALSARLATPLSECREDLFEPGGALMEILRQHARGADDRHEVRIAVPSRHQMHVYVLEDSGACRLAEVDADVDAMGLIGLDQRFLAKHLEIRHLVQFLRRQSGERWCVPVRNDHHVAVVVGI